MNPDSEIQLIEAAQNGHLEGFRSLYERYYSSMAALTYSILYDRDMAEDAAQETFATACCGLHKLKSKEKFGVWLAGICRNTAKQMLRSQRRSKKLRIRLNADYLQQNRQNQLYCETVRQAVRNLNPADRELIVLRYYDNLPYERIATVLNISTQALNGRLIRAKKKLAKYLKKSGLSGDEHGRS